MAKKIEKKIEKKMKNMCAMPTSGCGGCGYFLGAVGAAVYYISTTTGFLNIVVALLKALVWPAFLVFEVLKFISA